MSLTPEPDADTSKSDGLDRLERFLNRPRCARRATRETCNVGGPLHPVRARDRKSVARGRRNINPRPPALRLASAARAASQERRPSSDGIRACDDVGAETGRQPAAEERQQLTRVRSQQHRMPSRRAGRCGDAAAPEPAEERDPRACHRRRCGAARSLRVRVLQHVLDRLIS